MAKAPRGSDDRNDEIVVKVALVRFNVELAFLKLRASLIRFQGWGVGLRRKWVCLRKVSRAPKRYRERS